MISFLLGVALMVGSVFMGCEALRGLYRAFKYNE